MITFALFRQQTKVDIDNLENANFLACNNAGMSIQLTTGRTPSGSQHGRAGSREC